MNATVQNWATQKMYLVYPLQKNPQLKRTDSQDFVANCSPLDSFRQAYDLHFKIFSKMAANSPSCLLFIFRGQCCVRIQRCQQVGFRAINDSTESQLRVSLTLLSHMYIIKYILLELSGAKSFDNIICINQIISDEEISIIIL